MLKPAFHVGEEFSGVTTVQFNKAFHDILLTFLEEIIEEDMEPEIIAFRCALSNPALSRIIHERKQQQRSNGRHHNQRVKTN